MLIMIIVLTSFVSAWGVAPARQHAKNNYEMQELKVVLVNNDFQDGYFKVSFQGPLKDYAVYNGGLVRIDSTHAQVAIPFTLQLKDTLQPGRNVLSVVLEEVGSETSDTVGAVVTLVAEVVVNIPYEGSYVNAKLSVSSASENEDTPFTVSVLNTGTTTMPVWAEVVIKGPTNEPITTLTSEKKIISYGDSDKFELFWTGHKYPGNYIAEATVHYGDSYQVLTKEFVVGGDEVVSDGISSSDFSLGKIVPVEIKAINNWNTKKLGVYAEVYVLSKTGNIVQTFKSGPEDISPRSNAILSAYWDTAKLVVGEYDLNVLMHFDGKTTQKQYPVVVSLDKLNVMTPSGQVTGTSNNKEDGGLSSTLVILIVILIVVNIAGLVIIKSAFSKKKK